MQMTIDTSNISAVDVAALRAILTQYTDLPNAPTARERAAFVAGFNIGFSPNADVGNIEAEWHEYLRIRNQQLGPHEQIDDVGPKIRKIKT